MTSAQRPVERIARSGTFRNGMEYLCWDSGPKTLLFIQGGPGSAVPQGMMRRMFRRQFQPYLNAGYSVWIVTRRRDMPPGHTITDMAGDYAHVITEEFGGHVDVVVAESFGGMIAQYLAALHPDAFGRIVVVIAAAELSDWGKDVDARMAGAIASGDTRRAGTVFAEYLFPGARLRWLRRLLGPLIGGRLLAGSDYPPQDVQTEVRAELSFNSRDVLPRIRPAGTAHLRGQRQVLPERCCCRNRRADPGLHADLVRRARSPSGGRQQPGRPRRVGVRQRQLVQFTGHEDAVGIEFVAGERRAGREAVPLVQPAGRSERLPVQEQRL